MSRGMFSHEPLCHLFSFPYMPFAASEVVGLFPPKTPNIPNLEFYNKCKADHNDGNGAKSKFKSVAKYASYQPNSF